MDVIRLLSDSIANQIAAGEVVQRPASVVKELLENGIDANAKNIQLIVKDAGKTLVHVIDDGDGMSNTDARMCFERHATSKIKESADLFAIKTMGFRGEALASIAAVAQVELKTRREEDELATSIKIEGSDIKDQSFVQGPKGTSLLIKNLFFNVPARRNFLKGNPVEMKHILEEFQRVVLSYPEVSFSLFHNDIEIYNLPATTLVKRITETLDKSYRGQMAQCGEDTPLVKISGFVGNPTLAAKRRGDQFFFVNHRFIKSSYLHHAVTSAFESTISRGMHPFYVLFLEIDPSHIDINIHPTKTEIKFDDERSIYTILRSAVRQAVGVYNLTPSIDFESDINFGNIATKIPSFNSLSADSRQSIQNFEINYSKPNSNHNQKPNQDNWQKLFEGLKPEKRIEEIGIGSSQFIGSKANDIEESVKLAKEGKDLNAIQVHNKYIVAQVKSGLMIIDQKSAYERIFYEKYLKEINSNKGFSQQLLFPKTVQLTPMDFEISLGVIDLIRNLGFDIEEFGPSTYIINGVPNQFSDEDEASAFKAIIAEYKHNENANEENKKENLAKSLSKRIASKNEREISKEEISGLINKLFDTSMPSISPDGKPTLVIVSLSKLAELIG